MPTPWTRDLTDPFTKHLTDEEYDALARELNGERRVRAGDAVERELDAELRRRQGFRTDTDPRW